MKTHCPEIDCRAKWDAPAANSGDVLDCPSCGRAVRVLGEDAWSVLRKRAADNPSALPRFAPGARVVVVESVRSGWNVGSVFRTADGAGFDHVALAGITGTPPSTEISKTALGAEKVVSWSYHPDVVQLVQDLRGVGLDIVALEETGTAVDVSAAELKDGFALVIGNEVHGVSPQVLRAADVTVSLPMHGKKASLNVAVAFGVAAYTLKMS